MIRVTVYNEFLHEQIYDGVKQVYPKGIHECIREFLEGEQDFSVRTACFDMEEHGLSEEVLASTDVLIYWSHARQEEFSTEVAQRIQKHVLRGMGFVPLHSAHFSKPVKLLLGTSMTLRWKHDETEKLWCTCPSHPIAKGIPSPLIIPKEEMYGEYFDIPKPDELVFTGWFSTGDVFRSGICYTRGLGRIFYFQPGHEEYPVYYDPHIQQIIKNAVRWCYNPDRKDKDADCVEVR